jgi:uncharacterized protein (TIGR03083 family)
VALQRDVVSDGLLDELDQFESLLRSLTKADWAAPSRCDGWTVADVAAHTVGSMVDVVAGRLDGLGSPEVTARQVAERRGRRPADVADECAEVRKAAVGLIAVFDDAAWLAPAPGGFDGSLGDGVEALWFDTFIHADDIRWALDRRSETGPGLAGAVSHVNYILARRGWHGEAPDSADSADAAMAWVLVATGRIAASAGSPPNIYA